MFTARNRKNFIKFQFWPGCGVSVRVLGDTMINSLWMSFLEKNHIFFKIKKILNETELHIGSFSRK